MLESLPADRPVIVHIDDLQWAEPMLLDLLDHVVDLSRCAPILVLCIARPEMLEHRPGWGGGKLNATTLLLEPLAALESEALLDQPGDGLDPDVRARVIAASDGNPLSLEEMVALTREHWRLVVPSAEGGTLGTHVLTPPRGLPGRVNLTMHRRILKKQQRGVGARSRPLRQSEAARLGTAWLAPRRMAERR